MLLGAVVLASLTMAMNLAHKLCCSSDRWAKQVKDALLPWALGDVDLGDNTLEIGPGYGAILRVLVDQTPKLTSELDTPMAQAARALARRPGPHHQRRRHHVPTVELQDALFAEAFRVLRPGGVFAGSDSVASLRFRLLHIRDICNTVPPETLPDRLRAVGFHEVEVDVRGGRLRWRALKP